MLCMVVDPVADELNRLHERISGRFTRPDPRARVCSYVTGHDVPAVAVSSAVTGSLLGAVVTRKSGESPVLQVGGESGAARSAAEFFYSSV